MPSLLETWRTNPWVRLPIQWLFALALVLGGCWLVIGRLGHQAWLAAEREIMADGETLDFRRLVPPPVPDEENFCAIPALRQIGAEDQDAANIAAEGQRNRERLKALDPAALTRAAASPGIRKIALEAPLDVEAIAAALRKDAHWPMPAEVGKAAQDLALGLASWDVLFNELAAGLPRPQARWTPSLAAKLKRPWVMTSKPEMTPALKLAQALSLRARVAAHAGDWPRAFECLRICLRLANASEHEPLLICHLVSIAIDSLAVTGVWELSQTQLGTEQEWAQLEALFADTDAQAVALRCYRGELAAVLDFFLFARNVRRSENLRVFGLGEVPLVNLLLHIAPAGFFEGAASRPALRQLRGVLRPLRDGPMSALIPAAQALAAEEARHPPIWDLAARMSEDTSAQVSAVLFKVVYAQALANLAATACALERTRLRTGKYPASLNGITLSDGRPLPPDPVTGTALHYRPEGNRYRLWSIGVDEKDDGGTRGSEPQKTSEPDYRGDWVWSFLP